MWNSRNGYTATASAGCVLPHEARQFGDVAATLFNQIFTDEANTPIPSSRADLLKELIKESPKLRYITAKMIENSQAGTKLLIFCEYPITLLLIESVASLLGIQVSFVSMDIKRTNS